MNSKPLIKPLFAAARAVKPREEAPFAFEKRIMHRIRTSAAPCDAWFSYSIALWRAAAPCVAIMLAVGAWVYFEETSVQHSFQAGLESDLEQTMLAGLDTAGDTW